MKSPHSSDPTLARWHARRRWARTGLIYAAMIGLAMLFLSPLLFALVSSLKNDPLEYPPNLTAPQLHPANWAGASQLGIQGSGNPFTGGLSPGREIRFDVTYFVPGDRAAEAPDAKVPRRRPGSGLAAVFQEEYAADHVSVVSVTKTSEAPGLGKGKSEGLPGRYVEYRIVIAYPQEPGGPTLVRVPLDLTAPRGQEYMGSTITASRIERLGRVASYDNVSPGFIGYVLRNYQRVFAEARSVSSGQSLFGSWFLNTFLFGAVRVLTNLIFAAMAGYALARYEFRGRHAVFILVLLCQMIPNQVTFISNYLVLKDGVWGLSRLFGAESLLNTLAGLMIGGAGTMIEASKVFLMKQYFENLPRQVEESARVDGANEWQIYWRVMFPMAMPALGALIILSFQGAWNDFFWSFVILTSPDDIKTLPIGLMSFRVIYGTAGDWGLILAGAMLSAVPVILLFFVFQKYFMEGRSAGGSKE